jgi:hypothetical protein
MPIGEFPVPVLTEEEHKRLKPGMYKERTSNLQFYSIAELPQGAGLRFLHDSRSVNKVPEKFPFEIGDWVYVGLHSGPGEDSPVVFCKAQIQHTRHELADCCVVRLEPRVVETSDGRRFTTPSGELPYKKSLITQRAFPPIPYESKREIGTSDVPGGYLNLDWE